MTQQPEALRLADRLDTYATGDSHQQDIEQAAVELRRLDAALQSPQRTLVGLNHFDRTLLRTTYAPLKRLHHIKETNTDIIAEIVNDWDAFFTAIEAKLKEKNNG